MSDIEIAVTHRTRFLARDDQDSAMEALRRSRKAALSGDRISGLIDPSILSAAAKADWRDHWDRKLSHVDPDTTPDDVADMFRLREADSNSIQYLLEQDGLLSSSDEHKLKTTLQGLELLDDEIKVVYGHVLAQGCG